MDAVPNSMILREMRAEKWRNALSWNCVEDWLLKGQTANMVVGYAGEAEGKEHETVVLNDEMTLPALEHQWSLAHLVTSDPWAQRIA